MEKIDILSLDLGELKTETQSLGMKPFRAVQLFEWLHKKHVTSLEQMTNLSAADKEKLKEVFDFCELKTEELQISKTDGTRKYLFALEDGSMIESVWMSYHHGNSVCVSSQVGCRMGCTFCASTLKGLQRNLTAGEMLSQVYAIANDTKERVSNVVIMGCGEPLDNYDNVIRFIKRLSDPDGNALSQRNITLSTCGLVPGMLKLAEEDLQITLALSLHAPNDDMRQKIMPVAKSFSLDSVIGACRNYFEKTGRRVTFEYSLIKEVNDTPACADELSKLLYGMGAHVNLIPVNPVTERGLTGTDKSGALRFKNLLEKKHINATIRREMGRDIDGACGQLRSRHI